MELMSPSGNTSWRYVAGMLSSSRAPGADSSQRQCIGYCSRCSATGEPGAVLQCRLGVPCRGAGRRSGELTPGTPVVELGVTRAGGGYPDRRKELATSPGYP